MKNWYMWLVLAGIWLLTVIMALFEDPVRPVVIGYRFAAFAVMVALAFVQRACEKRGAKGKKILSIVYAVVIAALALFLAALLILY